MKRYIKTSTTLSKQEQFDIIQTANPAPSNGINYTWIRSVDDIQTFQEAVANDIDGYVTEGFTEDYTAEDIQNALKTGNIVVYSSYPIKNGVFVTPSKMEAVYGYGGGKGYAACVRLSDIAWIDVDQGQVATNRKIDYYPVRWP